MMIAHNLGLKLVPLAIALAGIVGTPAALAMERGGDRYAVAEVESEDQSRTDQCEQIKNTMAAAEELASEIPESPTSEADASPPTGELIEHFNTGSRLFSQMSELFGQTRPSDTDLQTTVAKIALGLSSISSDFAEVASLMAVVDAQQQELQDSGDVDPDDPESLQTLMAPLANLGEIMTLLSRINQSSEELEILSDDLGRYCGFEESVDE